MSSSTRGALLLAAISLAVIALVLAGCDVTPLPAYRVTKIHECVGGGFTHSDKCRVDLSNGHEQVIVFAFVGLGECVTRNPMIAAEVYQRAPGAVRC